MLVLHSHMPYVRHPMHSRHLEENWLFETLTESYIPLLDSLHRLQQDNIDFRITFSLTPTLTEMLRDRLLVSRYIEYLDLQRELAHREVARTEADPAIAPLSRMYLERITRIRELFLHRFDRDIAAAFAHLAKTRKVELVTSAATHAFLPAFGHDMAALRSQIHVGVESFRRTFGQQPAGFWLPECGYAEGIDRMLASAGLKYFFLEAHGLLNAHPRPPHSIYRPVRTQAGICAIGRDVESAAGVWSSLSGYPGDPVYRDFYRDIGFDLDYDYLRPWLPGGIRTFTGFKYFRVTGRTDEKLPYDPQLAAEKTRQHAQDFLDKRAGQSTKLRRKLGAAPLITAAYDTELFGHWWFEGPLWIEALFREAALKERGLRFVTPQEFLKTHSPAGAAAPAASSWGEKGFSEVWISPKNAWIYRPLALASRIMKQSAIRLRGATGLQARALTQALRELLLAQSSD